MSTDHLPTPEIDPVALFSPPTHIVNTLDGERVAIDDADALIETYEILNGTRQDLANTLWSIREALGKLADGDAKTRRVKGEHRTVKLTFPGTKWDQGILREAWEAFPEFRDEYLRIARIEPKLRETAKLAQTSGPVDFNTFRKMVAAAESESTAPPTVKVEE